MTHRHRPKSPPLFEPKSEPILPRTAFVWRMLGSFGITLLIVTFSLFIGGAGYHYFENLPWIDALLNASMILTGMGPVDVMHSFNGKVFAIAYSLYSGIAFLTMMAILLAPIIHRLMHQFHVELDDKD